MNPDDAATLIQRRWRKFAQDRRADPDLIRALLQGIGRNIWNPNDFRQCLSKGKIIVQANGKFGDPLQGHSCFFVNMMARRWWNFFNTNVRDLSIFELGIAPPEDIASPAIRDAQGLLDIAKYPLIHHPNPKFPFGPGIYAAIYGLKPMDPLEFHPKMHHLMQKGSLFVLSDAIDFRLFERAFHLERIRFKYGPNAYGLHYNCNTFVAKVLQRIVELS